MVLHLGAGEAALRPVFVSAGGVSDLGGDDMIAFVDWVDIGRFSMWLAEFQKKFCELRNLTRGSFKLDAGGGFIVGNRFGCDLCMARSAEILTFESDRAVLGLGLARAIDVGDVHVEGGNAVKGQDSGDRRRVRSSITH